MSDDIVTRLRNKAGHMGGDSYFSYDGPIMCEAATEIERLRTEHDRLYRVANESVASLNAIRHTLTDEQKQLVRDLFDIQEPF